MDEPMQIHSTLENIYVRGYLQRLPVTECKINRHNSPITKTMGRLFTQPVQTKTSDKQFN